MSIKNMKEYFIRISNSEVILFFLFTLAWAWTVWIIPILVTNSLLPYSALLFPPEIFLIIGAIAPSLIALALIEFRQKGELFSVIKGSMHVAFPIKWWAPLVLVFPLILITSYIALRILFPSYALSVYLPLMANSSILEILLFSIIFAIGGEFGWRQYALNQLQKKFSPLNSSIIIGCFWSLFYFPLYLIEGLLYPWWTFPSFIVLIIVVSVMFTWIYNNTKSSLIAVIILNIEFNMFLQLLFATNIVSCILISLYYIPLLLFPVDLGLTIVTSLSLIIAVVIYFNWDSEEKLKKTSS